jgi:hypothetical protein
VQGLSKEDNRMTNYSPLYPLMREDLAEFDWMIFDSWVYRARRLALFVQQMKKDSEERE